MVGPYDNARKCRSRVKGCLYAAYALNMMLHDAAVVAILAKTLEKALSEPDLPPGLMSISSP